MADHKGEHDELIARAEAAAVILGRSAVLIDELATAIRFLQADLDAERKTREDAEHRVSEVLGDNALALQRAEAAEAKLRGVEAAKVTCQKDGVMFGKYCWFSHETITGCEAALIPTKHKQYYEWFLAALAPERTVAGQEANSDTPPARGVDTKEAVPAADLLPGLERAAEIGKQMLELEVMSKHVNVSSCQTARYAIIRVTDAIRAEISRLKGEGSDHE